MTLPNRIENKTAKTFQNILIGLGLFMALVAFGAFASHDGGAGVINTLIAAGLLWAASQIKTTYDFVGGVGIYR